jgi:hypothetical protein
MSTTDTSDYALGRALSSLRSAIPAAAPTEADVAARIRTARKQRKVKRVALRVSTLVILIAVGSLGLSRTDRIRLPDVATEVAGGDLLFAATDIPEGLSLRSQAGVYLPADDDDGTGVQMLIDDDRQITLHINVLGAPAPIGPTGIRDIGEKVTVKGGPGRWSTFRNGGLLQWTEGPIVIGMNTFDLGVGEAKVIAEDLQWDESRSEFSAGREVQKTWSLLTVDAIDGSVVDRQRTRIYRSDHQGSKKMMGVSTHTTDNPASFLAFGTGWSHAARVVVDGKAVFLEDDTLDPVAGQDPSTAVRRLANGSIVRAIGVDVTADELVSTVASVSAVTSADWLETGNEMLSRLMALPLTGESSELMIEPASGGGKRPYRIRVRSDAGEQVVCLLSDDIEHCPSVSKVVGPRIEYSPTGVVRPEELNEGYQILQGGGIVGDVSVGGDWFYLLASPNATVSGYKTADDRIAWAVSRSDSGFTSGTWVATPVPKDVDLYVPTRTELWSFRDVSPRTRPIGAPGESPEGRKVIDALPAGLTLELQQAFESRLAVHRGRLVQVLKNGESVGAVSIDLLGTESVEPEALPTKPSSQQVTVRGVDGMAFSWRNGVLLRWTEKGRVAALSLVNVELEETVALADSLGELNDLTGFPLTSLRPKWAISPVTEPSKFGLTMQRSYVRRGNDGKVLSTSVVSVNSGHSVAEGNLPSGAAGPFSNQVTAEMFGAGSAVVASLENSENSENSETSVLTSEPSAGGSSVWLSSSNGVVIQVVSTGGDERDHLRLVGSASMHSRGWTQVDSRQASRLAGGQIRAASPPPAVPSALAEDTGWTLSIRPLVDNREKVSTEKGAETALCLRTVEGVGCVARYFPWSQTDQSGSVLINNTWFYVAVRKPEDLGRTFQVSGGQAIVRVDGQHDGYLWTVLEFPAAAKELSVTRADGRQEAFNRPVQLPV